MSQRKEQSMIPRPKRLDEVLDEALRPSRSKGGGEVSQRKEQSMIPRPKRLDEVLDEHTTLERGPTGKYRVFTGSGNVYREVHLHAIDNHNRMFVPIVDDIERSDQRIVAAPSDAIARLLQREGIIT